MELGATELGADVGLGGLLFESSFFPSFAFPEFPCPPDSSKTTKVAVTPLGTVTTQKAPPPAPLEELPTISFTLFLAGSIAQGRPLQPGPSHSIFTPHLGISFLKGVASSRYIGFQPSLMKVCPLLSALAPAT